MNPRLNEPFEIVPHKDHHPAAHLSQISNVQKQDKLLKFDPATGATTEQRGADFQPLDLFITAQ